jgi:hypothetical protein
VNELPPQIFRKWMHSREEDQDGIMVYRGERCNFPPARGRDGIEFKPDGTFVEWAIGAGDNQQGITGHWEATDSTHVRVSFNGSRPARSMEIVQVDGQVLKVR